MKNEHLSWLNSKSEQLTSCYQYDVGQKIVFKKTLPVGTEVQFDDGTIKVVTANAVEIPNSILQTAGLKNCYVQIIGADHETTTYHITFKVIARSQKDDYVSPDDEQTFREQLQEALDDKQDALTAGQHITIVDNVISAEAGMTTNERSQLNTATSDITSIKQDITNIKSGLQKDASYHLGFYLDENGDLCQVEEE